MELIQERRVSIVFFMIGLLSGAASWYATEQIRFSLVDDWIDQSALVGVIFGAFVGASLLSIRASSIPRVAVFLMASEACWLLAYTYARDIAYELLSATEFQMTVVGITAGMLGAAALSLCCAYIFPFYRASNRFYLTVIFGGLAGGTLGLEEWGGYLLLSPGIVFPAWQGSFAYLLASTIPSADNDVRH